MLRDSPDVALESGAGFADALDARTAQGGVLAEIVAGASPGRKRAARAPLRPRCMRIAMERILFG